MTEVSQAVWDAFTGDPMDAKNDTAAGLARVVALFEGEISRLRNKVKARSLTDGQLADEIDAVDAVCAGGFGEGGGSPGEWWYERADELEHERKRREIEAQLSDHNSLKVKSS